MSVSSTARKQIFAGGQAALTFTFRALTTAPTDIKLRKTLITTGAETEMTYTTEYTAAISADGVGGVVTVSPTISTAYNLTVYRETTNTQESDYDDYNQFPANTLETDLDRRTLVEQEIAESIDRSIKLPISNTLTGLTLPNPSDGKTLKWVVSSGTVSMENSTVDIDTAIAAAQAAQTAAELAETNAETAETNAETAETNAETAETNAEASETAAGLSATTASAQALEATTQATSALTYSNLTTTNSLLALEYSLETTTQATLALTYSNLTTTNSLLALGYKNLANTYSTTALTYSNLAATYSTTALGYSLAAATSATTALATIQVAVNPQTGNYALAVDDVNKLVTLDSAGTITLTVPINSTIAIPTGSIIGICQLGAGKVTISPSAGVTVNVEVGYNTTGSFSTVALLKTDTDEWLAVGSLEA